MPLYQSINDENRDARFGTWTVIGPTFSIRMDGKKRDRVCVCECDCGRIEVVNFAGMRRGLSRGCLSCRSKKVGDKCRRHGLSKTRVHNIWWGMIVRCTTPTIKAWPRYGGRGITVCERWRTFENFLADMGQPPTGEHEIDRIDPDGNYEPANCRWATLMEQARNKRNTLKYEYRGKVRTVGEISEMTGIESVLINERLRKGWTIDVAAETPTSVSGYIAKRSRAASCSAKR